MRVNLPWRPTISFTGTSDYVVDSNGLIVRHVDYWDSLQDSAFFSLPAVLNVILQCRPSTVAPTDLGGFELLRRTATFDIRRFKDVRIVKEADAWVIAPITSEDYVELTFIAAVSLTALPSQSEMMHLEKELRGQLVGASFAQPASRCFYVRLCLRDITVHEFWLELSSANARLDL